MTFSTVKKIAAAAVFLFLVLTGIFFGASAFHSPQIAEDTTRQCLKTLGFDVALLPRAHHEWGALTYYNVSFDKDGISTAKSIEVRYNPFGILIGHKIGILAFTNLEIIGEWKPEGPDIINFSGWKIPSPLAIPLAPLQRLRFTDARISVLTPEFGGLSLDFDFEGSLKGKKLQFQSHLKSAQKYISFTAGADGVLADGYSNVDVEVDQGKFEVPEASIRATRVHGWFNYSKDKSGAEKTMAELRAGGMTVLDMPWQNASATLENKGGIFRIFSEAKSVGAENVELDLDLQKEGAAPPVINGSIHADSGASIASYLGEQKRFELPKKDMVIIENAKDLKIDFVFENGAEKKIKYRMNTMENAPVQEVTVR